MRCIINHCRLIKDIQNGWNSKLGHVIENKLPCSKLVLFDSIPIPVE